MKQKQSVLFAAINNVIVRFGQQLISLFKHIIIAGYIGLSNELDIFYMSLAIFAEKSGLMYSLPSAEVTTTWKV